MRTSSICCSWLHPLKVWSLRERRGGSHELEKIVLRKLNPGSSRFIHSVVPFDETELPPLAFRKEWLKRKAVTSQKNLRVLTVRGDSMSPYLASGDIVMIDMGQKDVEDGHVYAIRYGDELRIKRLYKTFDGGIRIVSDNPTYPEERISRADMAHVGIIGKAIWRAG